MASGRDNRLAGQIAEYLVCAELGRRRLFATPFSGNVPTFDVLATDEQCRTVPIQVKASRGASWRTSAEEWMRLHVHETGVQEYSGPTEIDNPELIYVCAAIAAPGGRDRFFVFTKANLQQVCIRCYTQWMRERGWKRPKNPQSYDCRYDIAAIEEFEDNWELISSRLVRSAPDPSLVR